MKLLASADHHLDEHSRFDECIRVHHNLENLVAERDVDLCISAGDIYERASAPQERRAAADHVVAVTNHCPYFIVKGNHDREHELNLLARLKTKFPVYVIDKADVIRVAGASIGGIAWPDAARIAETARRLGIPSEDLARSALQNVIRYIGDRMAEENGPRILVGHFMVDGAVVSSGQPLLGQPINIGLADLALARAHLGVMGHIHKSAQYDVGGAPFFYTGSPFRTDFGQLEEKTFLFAEFDGERLLRTEQIPTGATPMIHLTGEWRNDEKTIAIEWDEKAVFGAEVRLRYEVPRDIRTQAWGVAQEHKKAILECGAKNVKVEEVPVVVKRARAPEVARARTITEKLDPHWKAIGWDPGERREALLSKSREVEEVVGTAGTGPTSLRLHRYSCENLGPHRSFSFDLDEYPIGSIIAFTGPNGAGKTTMLESAIGGTCHRKMPTTGTLAGRATARESKQEAVVSAGGRAWTIRHTMDAISGKSEALVLNEEDAPEYPGTKVTSFDKWAARFLPDPSVLYATQFSSQPAKRSRPRFIDLDSAERISVLLKALGVERIEAMATEARKRRDAAEVELEKITTRLSDVRERVGDIDELRAAESRARAKAEEADELLALTRKSLETLQEEARKAASEEERRVAKRAELEETRGKLKIAQDRKASLEQQIHRLEVGLRSREEDEAFAKELPKAREEMAAAERARDECAAIERDNARIFARIAALQDEAKEASEQVETLQKRIAESQSLLDRGDSIRSAAQRVTETNAHITAIDSEWQALFADIEKNREIRSALLGSKQRLEAELSLLDKDLSNEQKVADAVERLPMVEATVEEERARFSLAAGTLEELQAERLVVAGKRIDHLRGGLQEVFASPLEGGSIASRYLEEDDAAAVHQDEGKSASPAEIEEAKLAVSESQARLSTAEDVLRQTKPIADLRDHITKCKAKREDVAKELSSISAEFDAVSALLEEQSTARKDLAKKRQLLTVGLSEVQMLASELPALETARAVTEELRSQREAAGKRREKALDEEKACRLELSPLPDCPMLQPLRIRVTVLEAAEKRVGEHATAAVELAGLRERLADAADTVFGLGLKVEAFGDLSPVEVPDTSEKKRAIEAIEVSAREWHSALAVAVAARERAESCSAEITGICQEKERVEADMADWTRLSLDFGRAGIQSAEVDAAGPMLTDLANELLEECHGARFRMSFDTSKLSADGKKSIDEFRIVVLDSVAGREDDATTFSGGERVLLGECVENALLMLSCIHADATNATIVRDESGAALDPANSRAYFAMLRAVVKKVRAANLLLVSHSPEIQEMCDARIEITAGIPAEREHLGAAAE